MQTIVLATRLNKLRTTLARHPEHGTLLQAKLHLNQVDETLASHLASLQQVEAHETTTNHQSDTARDEVRTSWNQVQSLVRQATNLLEWHVESNFPALLPEFTRLPTSHAADARAQTLLDFATSHATIRTHQDVNLLLTTLAEALTRFHTARAALPTAKAAENTADTALRLACHEADTYADCLEACLARLLAGDRAALQEYGLVRQPRATPEPIAPPTPTAAG